MKSLKETISIFDLVVSNDYTWFDEKTALMTIEVLTDALHHLKNYNALLCAFSKALSDSMEEGQE